MSNSFPKIARKPKLKLQRSVSTNSKLHLPMISSKDKSKTRPVSAKITSFAKDCVYEAAIEDTTNDLTTTLYDSIPGLTLKSLSNTLSGLGLQASEAELLDISSDCTMNGTIKISNAFIYHYFMNKQDKFKNFSSIVFWLLDNDKDGIITLDDLKNVSILTGENDLQLINGMYMMLQELSRGRPIDFTVFNTLLEREVLVPKDIS